MILLILKQPLENLLQNDCSKSVLNKLKYVFESVLFLLKFADYRSETLIKLSLFTVLFSNILIKQTA